MWYTYVRKAPMYLVLYGTIYPQCRRHTISSIGHDAPLPSPTSKPSESAKIPEEGLLARLDLNVVYS